MMRVRPDLRFACSHPAHAVALGFGAGLAPFAPGTFGTLLAWPVGAALFAGPEVGPSALVLIAALFAIGVWACARTGWRLGAHDHSAMVWDEFVAFLLMLAIVPASLVWQVGAFVLFRFFDILKPPPIRWLERRFRGGFGVMVDDLVAAGCALLCLAVFQRLLA